MEPVDLFLAVEAVSNGYIFVIWSRFRLWRVLEASRDKTKETIVGIQVAYDINRSAAGAKTSITAFFGTSLHSNRSHSNNNVIHEPHVETTQFCCTPLSINNIRSGGHDIMCRTFGLPDFPDFRPDSRAPRRDHTVFLHPSIEKRHLKWRSENHVPDFRTFGLSDF